MKIRRVEHIAVAVPEIGAAKAMLENVFGLKMESEEEIGPIRLAMYPVGETYLELLQSADPDSRTAHWAAEKGTPLYHLCFEVEDIDAALEELRGKGVKLLDEVPRGGHGGSRIAFIDPECTGNVLIELAELPAAENAHP